MLHLSWLFQYRNWHAFQVFYLLHLVLCARGRNAITSQCPWPSKGPYHNKSTTYLTNCMNYYGWINQLSLTCKVQEKMNHSETQLCSNRTFPTPNFSETELFRNWTSLKPNFELLPRMPLASSRVPALAVLKPSTEKNAITHTQWFVGEKLREPGRNGENAFIAGKHSLWDWKTTFNVIYHRSFVVSLPGILLANKSMLGAIMQKIAWGL